MSHLASFIARLRPAQPVYRSWWRAVCSFVLVALGVAAGVLTYLAGRAREPELAYYGALACFAFVVLILAFVVPPLVRAARAEVRAIQFPVRLTAGGLLFVVLLGAVAFAAWKTANNVLFMIFSVMISTLFVQWAAGRASLQATGIAVRFPDHIFAGEMVVVSATLQNFKRVLPALFVRIEASENDAPHRRATPPQRAAPRGAPNRSARLEAIGKRRGASGGEGGAGGRHELASFEYVKRGDRVEQTIERVFERRGEVSIGAFTLVTNFPFGLLELRRRLRAREVRLVIYPQLEAVRARFNLPPLARAGELAGARRGQGTDLYALREYLAGDDRRHIDWKATARTRRLTVREFASEAPVRVRVVLDAAHYDLPLEERAARFEQGVTLAASLIAHFIRQGSTVALTITNEISADSEETNGGFGNDQAHLYRVLRRLAYTNLDSSAATPPARFADLQVQTLADSAHLILITATPNRAPLPRMAHVVGY